MQIHLTGHHVEITPALRDYVHDKLGRVERYFDNVTSIHVVLGIEKLRHTAEATVHAAGGELHADAVDGDMYAAIDALSDKIDRQVRKHKDKLSDHHRNERARNFP